MVEKIKLSATQIETQNQILMKMKNEINDLQTSIEKIAINNEKNLQERKIRIFINNFKNIVPYVLVTGAVIGVSLVTDSVPFYLSNERYYLNVMTEINSNGKVRYEEQYSDFDSYDDYLTYVGKWEKLTDGRYSRPIKTYNLQETTMGNVEELLKSDYDIFDSLFINHMQMKNEIRENLTTEELNEEAYLQISIYDVDHNTFIVNKQDVREDNDEKILYTMLLVVLIIIVAGFSKSKRCLRRSRIDLMYPILDDTELKNKLELVMSNYHTLSGK